MKKIYLFILIMFISVPSYSQNYYAGGHLGIGLGTNVRKGFTMLFNICSLEYRMSTCEAKHEESNSKDMYFSMGYDFFLVTKENFKLSLIPYVGFGSEGTGQYYCEFGVHEPNELHNCSYVMEYSEQHFIGSCAVKSIFKINEDMALTATIGYGVEAEKLFFTIGLAF